MAQCIVCAEMGSVFCVQDNAFLCLKCDKSIHECNVIARSHKRLPLCELCKRSAATVYCKEDMASLCPGCNSTVHDANPICHCVMDIDAAITSGLVKCAGLPFHLSQQQQGEIGASLIAPAVPAEDQTSACDEYDARAQSPATETQGRSMSEGNTHSLAVVPEMPAADLAANSVPSLMPQEDTFKASFYGSGKDLEALEFEASWLGGLDVNLDFGLDFLGSFDDNNNAEVPAMVPIMDNLGDAAVPTAAHGAGMKLGNNTEVNAAQFTSPVMNFFSVPESQHLAMAHSIANSSKQQTTNATAIAAVMDGDDLLQPLLDDDFVVPSFLPDSDDDEDAQHQQQHHLHHNENVHAKPAMLAPMPPSLVGMKRSSSVSFIGTSLDEPAAKYAAFEVPSGLEPAPPPPPLVPPSVLKHNNIKSDAFVKPDPLLLLSSDEIGAVPSLGVSAKPAAAAAKEAGPASALYLNGANLTREQRVARYREKRKNRKFQKTIRYASRKAYAEVRPRIKGRFATAAEVAAWKAKQAEGFTGGIEEMYAV